MVSQVPEDTRKMIARTATAVAATAQLRQITDAQVTAGVSGGNFPGGGFPGCCPGPEDHGGLPDQQALRDQWDPEDARSTGPYRTNWCHGASGLCRPHRADRASGTQRIHPVRQGLRDPRDQWDFRTTGHSRQHRRYRKPGTTGASGSYRTCRTSRASRDLRGLPDLPGSRTPRDHRGRRDLRAAPEPQGLRD